LSVRANRAAVRYTDAARALKGYRSNHRHSIRSLVIPPAVLAPEAVMEVLKVSSHSSPNSVAGALAGVVREQGAVEMQTVGAGALNQAIKAVAIARGFLAPSGVDLTCVPAFADISINGEERTAIRLLVEPRDMRDR
jgi:stage V sporulation protein S